MPTFALHGVHRMYAQRTLYTSECCSRLDGLITTSQCTERGISGTYIFIEVFYLVIL